MLIAVAVIATSPQVHAQQIDYDFSGTVEEATGALSTVTLGSNVSGSFTIDLGNATDPDCFVAPVSDPFLCEAASGTSVSGPMSTNYIITFVVNVDGYTYRTIDFPQGAVLARTRVSGQSGHEFQGNVYNWWNGTERQIQEELPTDNASQSSINLYNPDIPPYTNTGYPEFSGATFGKGFICARIAGPGTGGCVGYDITSITPLDPVPVYVEPRQAPITSSGGGSIGFGFLFALLIIGVFANRNSITARRDLPFRLGSRDYSRL
ncbi:MAG: hypothetical protein ACR2RD_01450 [Woeseiaceae bacterium]